MRNVCLNNLPHWVYVSLSHKLVAFAAAFVAELLDWSKMYPIVDTRAWIVAGRRENDPIALVLYLER